MSAEEYVRKVVQKDLKDPVITAQLANGFAIREVLRDYLPSDQESCGYAVFMEWLNPQHHPEGGAPVRHVRVAAVQYQMRTIPDFESFEKQCEFFVDTASEYRMDFVLFPEMVTNQLLALVPASRPGLTARRLHEFTDRYVESFRRMAMKYNINIVGGSHLTVEDDKLYNIAYLFRRDGSVERQYKLHITPSEERWWGVSAGDEVRVFDTNRGKISIQICYDIEFPETARIAAAKGANLLFVPFNTDIRSGYMRVRACAQARCIENGMYAVLAGPVGNLPFVEGADIHYGQACILTPSDLHFARDGVAEEATPNVERDHGAPRARSRGPAPQPPLGHGAHLARPTFGSLPGPLEREGQTARGLRSLHRDARRAYGLLRRHGDAAAIGRRAPRPTASERRSAQSTVSVGVTPQARTPGSSVSTSVVLTALHSSGVGSERFVRTEIANCWPLPASTLPFSISLGPLSIRSRRSVSVRTRARLPYHAESASFQTHGPSWFNRSSSRGNVRSQSNENAYHSR